MIAAAHACYGQQTAKCPRCKEPDLRKRWGCDEDADRDIFGSTCTACVGGGCAECDGHGKRVWRRCPSSQAGAFGMQIARFWNMSQQGILPEAGGYGDQPAKLMRLIEIFGAEVAKIRNG